MKIKLNLPTFSAVFFTIAILVGVFFWFRVTTNDMVTKNNQYYLEEITKAQASTFHAQLEDQLIMLEAQARYFEDVDMTNLDEITRAVSALKEIGEFKTIGVANLKGESIDTAGKYTKNISRYDYFASASKGTRTVSKMTYYNKELGEVLVLAVPIMQKKAPAGIVYGYFKKQSLSSMIQSVSHPEKTASILFTLDGTILAREADISLLSAKTTNFYEAGTKWQLKKNTSLDDIKLEVLNGNTVILPYKNTENINLISILAPLGVHDWYYAMLIPVSVITRQSKTISNHVLLVILFVSMAFIVLFTAVLFLLKSNEIMAKTNEKYMIVSTQTQTIVFDYDFDKSKLELNGSLETLFSEPQNSFEGKDVLSLLSKIHEDDNSFRKELLHLRYSDSPSVMREIRILCVDEIYYWFKITGTIVRHENGTPARFVGNIINVEEEVNKEKQLTKKAEEDALTGLLNKGAFADYVQKRLDAASPDDLYAFYIIDLDNFKKVNDTLGHIVGDRVISDTAQKLCVVFSNFDYVGRIGGDEFAAFLNLSTEGKKLGRKIIESKAQLICKKLKETYSDGTHSVTVSASVGVSLYPQSGVAYEELYKNADTVLYKSKTGGKNQFHIAE